MKIIRALLVLFFLGQGITKLIGLAFWADSFQKWGFTPMFMYIIGALEILGAIGLLIPKLRMWATLGLLGLLVGVYFTMFTNGEPITSYIPATAAALLLAFHLGYLWKRRGYY
jgi:putative oxidoreductase